MEIFIAKSVKTAQTFTSKSVVFAQHSRQKV